MLTKKIALRLAGGLLAVGMLAAFAGQPKDADACSNCAPPPHTIPGNYPQAFNPILAPDLVVWFDKAECNNGVVQLKVRVQNMGPNPAGNFMTDVTLDGVMMPGAPHLTPGPTYGGQVFHLNQPAAPGWHIVRAIVDSQGQVTEGKEYNNSEVTRVLCER